MPAGRRAALLFVIVAAGYRPDAGAGDVYRGAHHVGADLTAVAPTTTAASATAATAQPLSRPATRTSKAAVRPALVALVNMPATPLA